MNGWLTPQSSIWWAVLLKCAVLLLIVITTFAYAMLFERKVMGWMQMRPGPNRVGPWGLLQPAVDAVKLMLKEDLTPNTADPPSFRSPNRAPATCGRSATSMPASS